MFDFTQAIISSWVKKGFQQKKCVSMKMFSKQNQKEGLSIVSRNQIIVAKSERKKKFFSLPVMNLHDT